MDSQFEPIRRFLDRVRARFRALSVFDAAVRAALAMSAVLAVALTAWSVASFGGRSPLLLALLAGCALVLIGGGLVWALLPLRSAPSDLQLARFIEERVPALDDRLATAVDVVVFGRQQSSRLHQPLVEDAARRVDALDVDDIVPRGRLRQGGMKAAAATVVLLVLAMMAREPARQSLDAASLALFPARVRLDVRPGNARLIQGAPLVIEAQLVGNRAPVGARVEIGEADTWRNAEMQGDSAGQFRLPLASVVSGFKYRVVAGSVVSPTYEVIVAHPPRVVRIDADYTYPAALGLPPRTETDAGDVYAPAGTDVRLHVYTDRPMADGRLTMANGQSLPLAASSPAQLEATLKVVEDGSFRIALRDRDGLTDPGETEYFIRTVEDRAPEVHIVKPAGDRSVTRLEEVDIEARAEDDYGIERVELVYAVRGQSERVIPLGGAAHTASVTVRYNLHLEDLDVRPGDFVSYYVRARDVTRGSRSNEGRSDIFFLEVRPFEQEFSLAQSQSMSGSGHTGSIDDLVNSQKQIVVATWKLDRRGQNLKGAQSPADIRAIGRSEAELKRRVEEAASALRESTMRDPRRRLGRGSEPSDAPKVGQTMPEEDAMAAAVEAMGRAVGSLEALRTSAALPPEMQALNSLLEAQALVKKRQVSTQQSAQGGPGNNNRNYDISTLFDKELRRQQETRYETRPSSAEPRKQDTALEKIAELARRQDELLKRQQELARQQLADAELARQLEKLTREQSELRREAEELARRMSKLEAGQQSQSGPQTSSPSGGDQTTRQLREISEDMRNASGDMRRLGSGQAGASGSRALEKLKDLERRLRGAETEPRKPGDLQLEARQLADNQRQLAAQLETATGTDAMRRLAAEQQRLADRAKRLENDAKQQAGEASAQRTAPPKGLADRMQKSADALDKQAGQEGRAGPTGQAGRAGTDKDTLRREAAAQQAIARDLDKLAGAMGPAGPGDAEARTLSEQRARAEQLRQRIDNLTRDLETAGRQNAGTNTAPSGQKAPGQTGKTEEGRQAGAGGRGEDLSRLRDQASRELQQTRELIDELRRQDPAFASGGTGFTFEGAGMTFSSPGTEGFKQDFAKWQALRDQATRALERAESSLSKRLQQKETADRLAAGIDDKPPAAYQQQVDRYFKALGNRKPR